MKIEIILGRIFMLLLSTILAFLVLDRLSRPFLSHRAEFEGLGTVQTLRHPRPYVMFGGRPGTPGLNPLGYSGAAPALPKAAGEFRVFVLGGSTVLLGDPPIAALLEQECARNGYSQVKVYNFGVASSVSGMALARVVFEVADFAPDLVIFYNGGNDIQETRRWDPRPGYPFNFIAFESNPVLDRDIDDYPAFALFAYGSNIARSLAPGFFTRRFVDLEGLREEVGWETEPWKDRIAATYVDHLIKANRVSAGFGADFVAFFQPLLAFKPQLAKAESGLIDADRRDFALDMRERVRREIEAAKRDHDVKIVDLSAFYEGVSEQVFRDLIHTTQTSKPPIAREIFRQLIASGSLPTDANPGSAK